ncbi:MAG TPA: hypothetical protein PLG54_06640 [Bacteroidales bacterium]|jgi:hypothetical protein|nr:hypothetical protein [Bacteroidales bacterium]MDI9574544.1 hypothetical protein [Bacteroidota bacterium]MBP9512554.1 hypothetical protein [Bacteroidales bacterium]MBP9589169.1 hypothetical protein [Bacteroidales bacterium]NMD16917.1 hypothetical protein [Bacteroidales bacterium]
MKRNFRYVFLLLLILPSSLLSQGWEGINGTAAASMDISGVSYPGEWSGFSNPAGLAFISKAYASLSFENRFQMKELTLKGVSIGMPALGGVAALSGVHFGNSLYSEQRYNLAYSKRLGSAFYSGISIDYCMLSQGNGYGNASGLTFGLGLLTGLNENLMLGAYVFNPVKIRLSKNIQSEVPVMMKLGLLYSFTRELIATAEVVKNSECKAAVQLGVEYNAFGTFAFRTGVSSWPGSFAFGIGYHPKHLKLDVGAGFHPDLGLCPQAGLIYSF